ncbi:MAG TPA: sigma-54 dependent transcriptional regulator [Kofleriaceae bacterium]|nr:sigma-54 dependent transcriptional regulator [Kofleriaceae bacterium]
MSSPTAQILLVDRTPALRDLLLTEGHHVDWVDDQRRAHQLSNSQYEVVLVDLDLGAPDFGLVLCRQLAGAWPDTPVVVLTDRAELEPAVRAMRSGAYDVVCKPVTHAALVHAVGRAIKHRNLRRRVENLSEAVERIHGLEGFIGASQQMRALYEVVSKVGAADTTVLIAGESGSGKELVARAIHERSSRRHAPFVAINCAAVPPHLLESELFGHVAGAFTDAGSARAGLFAHAEGGTLLLDEIGEMPLEMQAKLLRVLQEHALRPVGGDREISFDVRVLAATNRDLEAEVERGQFRQDLYYRINVLRIEVPALRDRGNDILLLAEHFVAEHAIQQNKPIRGVSAECARKLIAYDWPGNVRELANVIERAVTLGKHSDLQAEDLPDRVLQAVGSRLQWDADEPDIMPCLDDIRQSYIHQVLHEVDGNRTRAAKILDLDRRTLYRRLKRGIPTTRNGHPHSSSEA